MTDLNQSLAAASNQFQIEYIKRAIAQCGGRMSQAATRLGLHRSNLYRKMRQLGWMSPESLLLGDWRRILPPLVKRADRDIIGGLPRWPP